jgi:signal transduction histidine kinase
VGPGVRTTPHSSGAGLLGMAERVALLGGTLRNGARDGGGFEVACRPSSSPTVTAWWAEAGPCQGPQAAMR